MNSERLQEQSQRRRSQQRTALTHARAAAALRTLYIEGDRAGEFKSVASIRMDETGDVDGDGFSASTLEFVRAIGMRMWA